MFSRDNILLPHLEKFQAEKCTKVPANIVFWGPMTDLLSIPCVLMKILSHGKLNVTKITKRLRNFKFCTFISIFLSNTMAVKGLSLCMHDLGLGKEWYSERHQKISESEKILNVN